MRIKQSCFIRLVSVLLAVVMLFTVTACNNNDTNKWDVSDDAMSQAIELTLDLNEETADRTVTVTYSQDIFKSGIKTEDIRVAKYYQLNSEEIADAENYVNYEFLEDVQLKFVSAKELELSFTETAQNVWMYEVIVHKDAVTKNVFAIGDCFPTVVEELEVTPEAEIEGTYTNLTSDPVITVNLTGTQANADMTAEMVTLSGAFEWLDIISVSAAGNIVRIDTSGSVAQGTSLTGRVTLAQNATMCGEVLSAATEVEYLAVYVDETSCSFGNGMFSFDVVSLLDKFTGEVAVSCDRAEIVSVSISEDKTKATISVAAETADDAAAMLNGSTLTLGEEMFVNGSEYQVYVSLPKASFSASIDYVSIDNTIANVIGYLYVSNGSLEELRQEDLSFGGDFVNAVVDGLVKQTDGSYIITFTFPTELADEGGFSVAGEVTVGSGKVKNLWGTDSDRTTSQVSYYSLDDRDQGWDKIMAFVEQHKGTFNTIGTVGSAIGGVASAANGINTILQLAGIVESTDDKLKEINRNLEVIASSITQLDNKLNNMSTIIIQNGVDEAERSYNLQRNQASMAWDQYLAKVATLNGLISQYNVNYYREVINFVNNAPTYGLTVYTTNDADVTLPGRIDGYDVNGERIISETNMQLGFELADVKDKVVQQGAAYEGIWDDIEREIKQKYSVAEGAGTYVEALKLQIAKQALVSTGISNIINAFRDVCYTLAGSSSGSPVSVAAVTPLDHYYTMLSCYYNFASEAQADVETMLGWLSGYLVKGASLATFAMACEDGVTVGNKNDIANAYSMAIDEITYQAKQTKEKSEKLWSLIADNTVKSTKLLPTFSSQNNQYAIHPYDDNGGILWASRYEYGNALTQVNIQVMRNRWNRMYEAGIVGDSKFEDYLVSVGLITNEIKSAYVMVEPAYNSALPRDNSVSLKVSLLLFDSDWFEVGKTFRIGTNGKLSSKYFIEAYQYTGKAYKLSDGSTVTRLAARATYKESHWYWWPNSTEYAQFDYSIISDQPLIVFEIGK